MKPFVSAIIVAAGSSTRMGCPKQFLPLGDKPVLAHTLAAFDACDTVDELVVVTRAEDVSAVTALTAACAKPTTVVTGGATRALSVINGLAACCATADYVAIHDGARPLVTPALITRTVADAVTYGAAAAAVPVKDTVKVAKADGCIDHTPDRSTLWAVQTPQVFRKSEYEAALNQQDVAHVTDDCQLFERLGKAIYLTMGDYANIKITTPEDIAVAKELMTR
jgi:2-C-methyl-D-erythritol 4-phosphate cytidylyltransferase